MKALLGRGKARAKRGKVRTGAGVSAGLFLLQKRNRPSYGSRRVLHVIDHLDHGGAQVLLVNICTARSAENGFIHEVLVLRGHGVHAEALRAAGVPVRSLGMSRSDLVAIITRLAAHVSRYDYDVLHLHLQASLVLGGVLSVGVGHGPAITTVYSLREQHKWGRFYLFALLQPILSQYVTIWENADLKAVGIAQSQITVIPIGIDVRGADPTKHQTVRKALCEQYGLALDQPLLLSVARLHKDRHIHILVETMIHIVSTRPNAVLLMVGDGEERERLEQFVARHEISSNVIFAGPRADIWELLPGCDFYLSSSGRCDTGVAAMQAMACQRPVITYTLAPEHMRTDEQECDCQGVFLQARDARAMAASVLRLLDDPTGTATLALRGREAVLQQFTVETMAMRYTDLYTQLLMYK